MNTPSNPAMRPLAALGLAVLVVAAGTGAATAVTLGAVPADSLRLSMADSTALDDVVVERRTLDLSGSDVVGVSTAINNTQLTDVSVDVIVQLEHLNGSVVERETTTVLLGALGVTIVDLSLSQPTGPSEFAAVNVTVEPSL